jgi:hypothetical protein
MERTYRHLDFIPKEPDICKEGYFIYDTDNDSFVCGETVSSLYWDDNPTDIATEEELHTGMKWIGIVKEFLGDDLSSYVLVPGKAWRKEIEEVDVTMTTNDGKIWITLIHFEVDFTDSFPLKIVEGEREE